MLRCGVFVFLIMSVVDGSPKAAVISEIEPNDSVYDAQAFVLGDTIQANRSRYDDLDWFEYWGVAGQRARIHLVQDSVFPVSDFVVELWGAFGYLTSSDTPPSGGVETETIEFTANPTGPYYVFVYSYTTSGLGAYRLETSNVTDPGPTPTPVPTATPTLPPITITYNPPVPLTTLNSSSEDSFPYLTEDGTEIFYRTDRGGDRDIWSATREAGTDPWNAPFPVAELNSSSWDSPGAISADGLEMFMTSGRDVSTNTNKVYRSTRSDRSSPWSAPVEVPELSPVQIADNLAHPHSLSSDGLRLYQFRRSGADWDIYVASRSSVGVAFTGPTPVPGMTTSDSDISPCLSADELTMIFTRDDGTGDVYGARRHDTSGSFVVLTEMTDLNDPGYTTSLGSASPDLHQVWLFSDRPGGSGGMDLYGVNDFTPTPTPHWKTGIPDKYWR
jgi:hypothetical protein